MIMSSADMVTTGSGNSCGRALYKRGVQPTGGQDDGNRQPHQDCQECMSTPDTPMGRFTATLGLFLVVSRT